MTGQAKAKYYTLPRERYSKGWFDGHAVTIAREQDLPLYVCEGPFDALALLADRIPTATAVLGLAAAANGAEKDLDAYWAVHHVLPDALVSHWRSAAAATFSVVPTLGPTGSCPLLPVECLAPAVCTLLGRCERLHGRPVLYLDCGLLIVLYRLVTTSDGLEECDSLGYDRLHDISH